MRKIFLILAILPLLILLPQSARAIGSPDSDLDGFSDELELAIGTNPASACAATPVANDEVPDSFPPDFNDDQRVNITDRTLMALKINSGVYDKRFDLNSDASVDKKDRNIVSFYIKTTKGAPCTSLPSDSDGDGFTDELETFLGTDPNSACAATPTANDEQVDSFPPDFNDDRKVNVTDRTLEVLAMKKFQANAANYDKRYDLNADGALDTDDLDLVSFFIKSTGSQPCVT